MADQDFIPQEETLFDDMHEMSEATFLTTLIQDMFIDDGASFAFMEFAQVIADCFEKQDSLEVVSNCIPEAMRTHIRKVFNELEMGDDTLLSKSSDKELKVAVSRALRAIGDAIV